MGRINRREKTIFRRERWCSELELGNEEKRENEDKDRGRQRVRGRMRRRNKHRRERVLACGAERERGVNEWEDKNDKEQQDDAMSVREKVE